MTIYNNAKNNNYAVSEVVGGMLLVLIAVISFSVIYSYFFYPLDPDYNTSVRIEGTVNDYGYVLLEHVGGNPLESYKIVVSYPNGTYIG
jgi:FlaG/FlaF family flagellin (archaellin)